MNLKDYFAETKGRGIMATGNAEGVVDTAIYSRPHVLKKDTVAFIMRDRLSHKNLQENGHANYMYMEPGAGYNGVRLFMTKIDETQDHTLIESMSRRHLSPEEDRAKGKKFLVYFKVSRVLNLIGGEEIPIS
jgi:hypothetical protein